MGRHNPNDRYALTALALTLLAIVLVAFFSAAVEIQREAHQPPNEQSRPAYPQYEPGQYGPSEGYTWPQFSARDTYAQWIMAILGIAATAISIWAVVELRRTLKTTKDGVFAAIKANEIQSAIFEADARPLIGFHDTDEINLCRKKGNLIANLQIKNYGKTFASNVRVYMDALSPTVLVASTVTSKEFARRKIGSIGTEPQMILPQQDRDFCIVSRIPKREGMTAGWIIRLCVTYQREGGTKTYYTAAQIVVKPEDAIAAYKAEGTVENIPCRYARESEVAV